MLTHRLAEVRSLCFASLVCLVCIPTLTAQTKSFPDSHTSKASPPQAGTPPAPAPPKRAGAKVLAPRPLLPPIVHDFTSLLEPPTKNATSAQLKNVTAFVSSDNGHSYSATVQTLAPDYAIVTNPVPPGETAVSVLIGNKQAGVPSITVPLSQSEVTKNVVITADLSAVATDPGASECAPLGACVILLATDGQTVIGEVIGLALSANAISVTYRVPVTATPAYIRVGKRHLSGLTLAFVPDNPSAVKESLVKMRQVIAADFCRRTETGACTTDFLKPHNEASDGCPADATGAFSTSNPRCRVTAAYVLPADDSEYRNASVNALGVDTADISFSAPSNFKPAWLALDTKNQSYRFAFTPAPPIVTSILNFESEELGEVCDATCALAAADHLKLKSLSSGDDLSFVAMQGKLVMARVTAPLGQEPAAIAVSNKDTKKSAIARRTVKPGQNVNELQVDMTIMDQTTAQRNYGNRIAKRYIAITLDVRNPTAKKVQFNKSAMYFDVDYVESKERKPNLREYFRETVAVASTLGMYQPSVYKPPFVARNPPRVARFGLEQNVRHSPVNYLSALGSFDYTAEKTDEKLRALELIGSLLSNIATGAIVADRSGAFRAGTSVFSATFLPGFRALTLNTSAINRLRSNLVAQTLQETIQVPAEGASTTIALLPRTGILSFTDAEIPVMVKRVIDVHLVPEVVIPVTEMPVQKGACQPGYRKDQARQAFGEPTGLITNPDGSSTFVYAKGPVASADFDTKGVLANCKPRTPTEQLNLATTLVEANEILSDLKLAPTKIDITDGSVVLVDIPGIQPTYHFDAKGNRAADYTFLFNDITAEKEKPKDDFDTFMESKAASLSSARSSQIKVRAADAAKNFKPGVATRYESPDIQWGWIDVVFKNTGTGKTVSLVVDQIIFHGDKPKAVN